MGKLLKDKKAITLIALVITIVVLVILAVVTINLTVGNDGLIARAIKAATGYRNAQEKDKTSINDLYGQLVIASDGNVSIDLNDLEKIILEKTYPVGSIYMTTDEKNPSETLGGTWVKYAEGKTIIGDGSNEGYTFSTDGEQTLNATTNPKGEYKHTLTTQEMPSHSHIARIYSHNYNQNVTIPAGTWYAVTSLSTGKGTFAYTGSDITGGEYGRIPDTLTTGGSQSHNNIQPYVTTYIWKRVS